ncbi:MAG: two pore domain potassium channel family protein [Halioglobus sp.]|nr:two pore domain potassium channel family protein [Halioglobus sp.]
MRRIHSHNNFYFFTASLVILLLASAFVSSTPAGEGHLLLQVLMFATELVAYFSLNLSRRWRIFVGVMLLSLMASTVMREFTDWSAQPLIGLGASLVFYCGMAYAAARQVLFSGDIEPNTIVGTVAVYLLLGLIWTVLYLMALEVWPTGINGIAYQDWHDNFGITTYFSYVTLSTLGYGDITAALPVTRTLAFLEAITGTFYMAVVVASMIGRVSKSSS